MSVRIYNKWEITMLYDMSPYCLQILRDRHGLQAYRILGEQHRTNYYISSEIEELLKNLDEEELSPKEKAVRWNDTPLTYEEWKAERRKTLQNDIIEQEQVYKIVHKK